MINEVSWVSFSQGKEGDDPLPPLRCKGALEEGVSDGFSPQRKCPVPRWGKEESQNGADDADDHDSPVCWPVMCFYHGYRNVQGILSPSS